MEVAVLGHRGMLGAVVARYFRERGAEVFTTDLRYDGSMELPEWAARFDLAVNCIRSGWEREMVDLPADLSRACRGNVIHPSTDAIRDQTEYGQWKRQAERNLAIIIRAGIVDVRNQPERAYTNWLCNPITPLEWAEIAWRHRTAKPAVYQYGREPLSRFDVARQVAQAFGGEPPQAVRSMQHSDRFLASTADLPPLDVALTTYKEWLSHS
jgi:dTDP-4-dehydrorhamnose reductase